MDENTNKIITGAIEAHREMVDNLQNESIATIAAAAKLLIESLKQGGRIYICGNGGSAADAQHIAGELVGRFLRERKALPAIALTTDTSVITSIANDYSYEDIFARQVQALAQEGDVLWALSTSGSSANIVSAVKAAKEKGVKVLSFTGKTGSKLEQISDICLCTDAEYSFSCQEVHQLAYHIICDLVERGFSSS